MSNQFRNPYTSDDERLLVKYIARYSPQGIGRSGNALYKTLVENEHRKWNWAERHTWQSWRDRYCKNKDWYEKRIRTYQKRHGIDPTRPRKTSPPPMRKKRARDHSDGAESGEEVKEEKDDREHKRQKRREDQKRAEMERMRRESLKEEEEEEEEEDDKGEGTSSGTNGRRIMRRKPVSTVKETEAESQVADDVTHVKPKEDGNTAVEEHDADKESSEEDGEQENHEPVGSNDYRSIFGPSEDEIEGGGVNQLTDAHEDSKTEEEMDAQEVDQQLIAPSKSESTASSSRNKLETTRDEPSDKPDPLYPTIESVPSPHLRASQSAEPQVPGMYATSATSPLPVASPSTSKRAPQPRRHPPAYAHAYPLLQRVILAADEDFFESSPSTPTPAPQNGNIAGSTTKTRPPKLIEGPYGNSFAGTRRSGGGGDSGTESEDGGRKGKRKATWPPERRRTLAGTEENGKAVDNEKSVDDSKVIDTGKAVGVHKTQDKGKKEQKQKQKAIPVTSTSIYVEAKRAPEAGPTPVPPVRRPRPQPQANAQASSSRTLLSDLPPQLPSRLPAVALPPEPRRITAPGRTLNDAIHRFGRGTATRPDAVVTTRQGAADVQAKPSSEKRVKEATRSDPRASGGRKVVTPPQVNGGHAQAQKHKEPLTNGKPVGSIDQTIPTLPSRLSRNGSLKRQPSSLRREMNFAMPSESWTPGNPFVDRPPVQAELNDKAKVKQKGKAHDGSERRHTIGTISFSETAGEGRRIDLREELARSMGEVRTRQSLPLRSRTTSLRSTPDRRGRGVSADASSPLLALPRTDEDLATVQLLGVSSALSMIAKNTSFSEETVMKVWQTMGSIARTEEYFNRLKSAVGEVSEQIYEAMEIEKEHREKEKRRESHEPGSEPQDLGSSLERIDLEQRISSPRRSVNSERQNLNIRHLPQDDDDDDVMSDYSPPHSSRAGKYTRLVKQGRREEALTREGRRASAGRAGVLLQREISPPEETSQSPEVQDEDTEEVPRTRSPTQEPAVIARVGGLGPEPPPDSRWGDEEEAAFKSASAENAHVLREIESMMAPEFMRRWAAMHLMQLRKTAQADEPPGVS